MAQGEGKTALVTREPMNRQKKRRLYTAIAAGGLLAIALCAVGIALLHQPKSKAPVNPGVTAAWQYITEYQMDREALMSPPQKALGRLLLTEAFEVEADITVNADNLQRFVGLPINKLVLGVDAKYDLLDLGVKLRLMGLEYAGVYLIGNDVVLEVMGDAYSSPLKTPAQGQNGSMGLGERVRRFSPLLSREMAFYRRLAEVAAQSVPEECTKVYDDNAFSPLDGADAGMTVIETTMDEAALQAALAQMGAKLQADGAMREQAEEMLRDAAAFYGLETDSLDEWLAAVADGSAVADDFELCWRVYERNGRYVGLAVQVSQGGQTAEYKLLSELNGRESHEVFAQSVNGKVVQSADYTVTYGGGEIRLEGMYRPSDTGVFRFTGQLAVEDSSGAYKLAGGVGIDGPVFSAEPQAVSLDIDADVRAGDGLDTLKESRAWQGVYGKERKRLTMPWQEILLP